MVTWLRWAGLAIASVGLGAGLGAIGLPSSYLFGALVAGLGVALLAPGRLEVPDHAFTGAQAVTGVVLGAYLDSDSLEAVAGAWLPVTLVSAGTLALSLMAGRALARTTECDDTTAELGLVAGGASGIVVMADELGADARLVAFMQYARVLVVVLLTPIVAGLAFPGHGTGSVATQGTPLVGPAQWWAVVMAVAAGGALAGRLVRLPNAALMGPLLVSGAITLAAPEGTFDVPELLRETAFMVIGAQVGLRFTMDTIRQVGRLLVPVLVAILGVIVGCFGLAVLLAQTTSVSLADAYLATTPGGLYAVVAVAFGANADTTFIVAVQGLRLLVMILLAPVAVRWLWAVAGDALAAPSLGAVALLDRIKPDLTPLRASRDLRLLILGNLVTGLGTQAALVALPYLIYVETKSAFLVGLLGAVELAPLVVMALYGGALADRMDRRRLLLLDQIGLVLVAAALAVLSSADSPPLVALYVLGGATAGFGAVQNVARAAIVPNLVEPALLRQALALNFGLFQLTLVAGPGLGGLLIAWLGVSAAFAVDAASCFAMVGALVAMAPQPPQMLAGTAVASVRTSIADGLRFVRGNQPLMGSFAIDLLAMTFGMPRALFAVLSLTVYHAGAEGTGLLYAAVSAGATVAALTTGWLGHARRLGRIVIVAVIVWGLAIAAAGFVTSLWPAVVALAIAGAADSVSAVCRSTINQTVTPDHMRGRMSSVFSLVVTSGPRLGDVEAGAAAAAFGARASVASGGLACVLGVGLVVAAFPSLYAYDSEEALKEMETTTA